MATNTDIVALVACGALAPISTACLTIASRWGRRLSPLLAALVVPSRGACTSSCGCCLPQGANSNTECGARPTGWSEWSWRTRSCWRQNLGWWQHLLHQKHRVDGVRRRRGADQQTHAEAHRDRRQRIVGGPDQALGLRRRFPGSHLTGASREAASASTQRRASSADTTRRVAGFAPMGGTSDQGCIEPSSRCSIQAAIRRLL
jgi:hypothetical protein